MIGSLILFTENIVHQPTVSPKRNVFLVFQRIWGPFKVGCQETGLGVAREGIALTSMALADRGRGIFPQLWVESLLLFLRFDVQYITSIYHHYGCSKSPTSISH